MRIAVGQLWQETNTLNPLSTTRADFEDFGVVRGAELVERMAEVNELGGFIQSLRQWPESPEIVGLVRLPAWPSGRATESTYRWLRDEMLAAVRAALPVDAVLLALHGSMAAEGHPDVEGEILADVRRAIGPDCPLIATLDLHANVTQRMVAATDALLTYHTAPHVDVYETGIRGAALLRRVLVGKAKPVTAFVKLPAVYPPEMANTEAASGVSVDLKRQLQELEQEPGILAAGLATVQPWLDVPELGTSVIIVTDNNPAAAQEACCDIAETIWDRRREYLPELVPLDQAVRRAHEEGNSLAAMGPVVLGDAADATTSGAPGDSVWILEELLRYRWKKPVLVTLVAPDVVEQARTATEGSVLQVRLGGVLDRRFGKQLELDVTVEKRFQAEFTLSGHLGRNMPIRMGSSVVLSIGQLKMIVTSRSGPHFAPELFRLAGHDPRAAAVVVAKSPCGFRAVYEPFARAIYMVRTPGCAPSDFWEYPYENISHPTWPWDEIESWEPEPQLFRSKL